MLMAFFYDSISRCISESMVRPARGRRTGLRFSTKKPSGRCAKIKFRGS